MHMYVKASNSLLRTPSRPKHGRVGVLLRQRQRGSHRDLHGSRFDRVRLTVYEPDGIGEVVIAYEALVGLVGDFQPIRAYHDRTVRGLTSHDTHLLIAVQNLLEHPRTEPVVAHDLDLGQLEDRGSDLHGEHVTHRGHAHIDDRKAVGASINSDDLLTGPVPVGREPQGVSVDRHDSGNATVGQGSGFTNRTRHHEGGTHYCHKNLQSSILHDRTPSALGGP